MRPFDPKCLELAEYFAADATISEEQTRVLAIAIQDAVEDFMSAPGIEVQEIKFDEEARDGR